jgi:uncharacterized protein with GYD domain
MFSAREPFEESSMPQYMLQFSYTQAAWAALTQNPVDRTPGVQAAAEKLGAKLISLHYTMGEYDGVGILEAPDDVTANALVLGVIAPGHIRVTKTTRLYTPAEIITSLKKAQGLNYKAPSGS